jgi:acetylornithine/succinyldiaminopimelate/putrescine aminotransferase
VRGERARLWDVDGNEYLDFFAGLSVHNAGHCHPKITDAITEQTALLAGVSNLYYTAPAMRLAERLVECSLGGKVFLCNSGLEANECALKLARKRAHRLGIDEPEVVVLDRAFHGRSIATLAATPRLAREDLFGALPAGFVAVPPDDPDALRVAVGEGTAAVLLEPVQGEAGGVVPPDDYLPRARELCTRYGALLIADEIQTGMGRTGKLWGMDHWNVVPDIMCVGKSIGGGVMPLSAFISTAEIWEVMIPNPIIHSTTFGGNPLACAAGLAAIEVTLEEDLPGQAARKGEFLLRELGCLQEKYPQVLKEAHGKGLLIGMEFPVQEIGRGVGGAARVVAHDSVDAEV